MILGAIEITTRSTRLSVVDVSPRDSVRIAERIHGVTAELDNLDRLTALLMAEVEAARDLGAERIEVIAPLELRGTRLVRLLERACQGIGVGAIRIPAERDRLASAYVATTRPMGDPGGSIGVATVGPNAVGLAVGDGCGAPAWVGSRPVGAAKITASARFSDPPRPNQIEAAINGASRRIASLTPPLMDRLLVDSGFSAVIERLCGPRIVHADARRGLDSILGQTSDDIAAWFGIDSSDSRLLPGAIVGHAALADVFGMPVEPVGCDHVAGRLWVENGARSTASGRPL